MLFEVKTQQDFDWFLEQASNAIIIAVDTETTAQDLRDGRGHAIGLSISFENIDDQYSTYFPIKHKNGTNISWVWHMDIKNMLENHRRIIFHNAKHDIESLATIQIKIENPFYDTMLMAHMVDENFWSKSLDALTKARLNDDGKQRSEVMNQFLKIMTWADVTPELIWEYAAYDADLTLRLFNDIIIDFASQGFEDGETTLWDYEQKFILALSAMERRGVLIDKQLCLNESVKGKQRMAEIKKELRLNPGSTKDLEHLLIKVLKLPILALTPSGNPSFNRAAMENYETLLAEIDSPVATLVLEYRGWQKTVSSNYDAYLDLLSPDGRLRPNYKIHGTITGRLSCEKPNLQQIPRQSSNDWNGNLKNAFIAKEGYTLVELDYSQIEFRLAAAYSLDSNLIDTFNSGEDIFTSMAEELGMQRQSVKTLTYATLYGGGLKRLSFLFKVTEDEAKELRDRYFNAYPGLKKIAQQAASNAKKTSYIKYWTGRRRHFNNPQQEAHKAFNSLIQGGAAEIVKRALINCYDEFNDDSNCRLLLQIHDALIFEIKDGQVEEYAEKIKAIMMSPKNVPDFGVKLDVAWNVWGQK